MEGFFRKPHTLASAKHTSITACACVFPSALTGMMDGWNFYSGIWFYPIQIKMVLGLALLVLLILLVLLVLFVFLFFHGQE